MHRNRLNKQGNQFLGGSDSRLEAWDPVVCILLPPCGSGWDCRQKKACSECWSQRKATPKNAQTTAQFHSSHMLVKYCSKFSKPGFSDMWTVNFLMFKLVLEKAEEPEIKLPTSAGSWKKQESSRKTSLSEFSTACSNLHSQRLWHSQ